MGWLLLLIIYAAFREDCIPLLGLDEDIARKCVTEGVLPGQPLIVPLDDLVRLLLRDRALISRDDPGIWLGQLPPLE